MDAATPRRCRNCGAALAGPYCAACGQKDEEIRRPALALVRDGVDAFLNLDGRGWSTLRALALRPGSLTRDYVDGRRARSFSPFRVYVFASVLFVLTLWAGGIYLAAATVAPPGESGRGEIVLGDRGRPLLTISVRAFVREDHVPPRGPSDTAEMREVFDRVDFPASLERGLRIAIEDPERFSASLSLWLGRILLVMLPALALILWPFYARRGAYLVEHLVFSIHFHAFSFLAASLVAMSVWAGGPRAAVFLLIPATLAYLLLAMKGCYRQSWTATTLKFVGVAALYVGTAILAIGAVLLTGIIDA